MHSSEESIREYIKPRFQTRELPSASFAGAYGQVGVAGETTLLFGGYRHAKEKATP